MPYSTLPEPTLSRRRFVQGLVAAGALTAAGRAFPGYPNLESLPELSGTEFELTLGEQTVNFTGHPRVATTVNGSLPAPLLRWREGENVILRVHNQLKVTSSIHWHGIVLPSAMDGVPGISSGFSGIQPGETFTYRFPIKQSGTYWYHSHSGFQEQTGLYGPIIIDPKTPDPFDYDRDHVVLLSDWSDENPHAVYAKLKKLSHYYNFNERTHTDLMQAIDASGLNATWQDRAMWNGMRMSPRDVADVTGYTYTYLVNGQPPASGWTGLFQPGERVRLRFINGSAMTFFDVRIPGLKMTVVAADGQLVKPVAVDEFRIGVAETYDVLVEPDGHRAYTIFAQDIARSGFARGTLTPDPALSAAVPDIDPIVDLSHADMGMAMGAHAGHPPSHSAASNGMDHSQHTSMSGMDHSQHKSMSDMDHNQHKSMSGMDHAMHQTARAQPMHPSDFSEAPVTHAATEFGPHVDMQASQPQYRLDDPGVGLRNNGRRVLTYADLRNFYPTRDDREPDREIEFHLTGNMRRYMWSINGVKHHDAKPLRWTLGERLRITFVNDTMMNHPMHLHGLWSDLESGDNDFLPRKHTVIVQPGSRISYRVTVDAEGAWAYHCHMMYHMAGMFRTVIVSPSS